MTPQEQIDFIAAKYPSLKPSTGAKGAQTSFWVPEMGKRGRVIRIKQSNSELKLAATALRHPEREFLRRNFKGPAEVLRKLVESELAILHAEAVAAENPTSPQRNRQLAVHALRKLGGKAPRTLILDEIRKEHPVFDPDDLRKALTMLSVNDDSRFAYLAAETKRAGGPADRGLVFRGTEAGDQTIYELYDPSEHGVWVAYLEESAGTPSTKGRMRLRRQDASIAELVPAFATNQPPFDPTSPVEGKTYVARQIAARQGQAKFRKELLAAYGNKCCLSECEIIEIVEAAHIFPYAGKSTNDLTNGLPLRADLHTLFDLGLIRIVDSKGQLTWQMHPALMGYSAYSALDGKVLETGTVEPSAKSIEAHRKEHAHQWQPGI
ncbi:HNH endonuclease [Variovorax sp. LjRoot178]|uniref:HNH endonuclease n=1 Tax=Variovorax sp. LjRoot178 TaxID=3342277 RepID=UPI003ECD4FA3